jgi:hypothetical protein
MECEVFGSAVSYCARIKSLGRCVLCCVAVCKGGLDVMERAIVILQALDLTASRLTPHLAIRRSARV